MVPKSVVSSSACCRRVLSTYSKIKVQINNTEKWPSDSHKRARFQPARKGKGPHESTATEAAKFINRRRPLDIKFNAHTAESLLLFKDDHIVAINKPAGLAVHGGPGLLNDLSRHLHLWSYGGDTPHLAHRLDKDVSGVLLLTRHTAAARRIATAFHERKLIKKYWAITVGVPDRLEGSIDIPLSVMNIASRSQRHSMNRVVLREEHEGNKRGTELSLPEGVNSALTRYKVMSVCSTAPKRCCLMEVKPVTGIKHQVRVHLADGLMCPILGDHKFGGRLYRLSTVLKKKVKLMDSIKGFMYLHAHSIEIPDYYSKGTPLVIKAPPPSHFKQSTTMLGLQLP